MAVLSVQRDSNAKNVSTSSASKESADSTKKDDEDGEEEQDEEARKKAARRVLEKYRGMEYLMNPAIFNMRKVREAKLPSANGHASAESLARVFDAIVRTPEHGTEPPLLSKSILELSRQPSRSSKKESSSSEEETPQSNKQVMLNDSGAKFGLGFQLHEFKLGNGDAAVSIGHAGLGGSVVIAIPEEETVVSFTLNHLSADSVARKRILGIIFDELGWIAPTSIPVENVRQAMST